MILVGKRLFTAPFERAEQPLTPRIFGILAATLFAAQFVVTLFSIGMEALLSSSGYSFSGSYAFAVDAMTDAPGIVYVVLIGPVFEELVFRGAIMGSLRRFGVNFSIIISSIIFGFFHILFAQIPAGFLLGLVLGYAASRYSLRCSIALHILNNGVSMLFYLCGWPDLAMIAVCAICLAVVVLLYFLKKTEFKARIAAGAPFVKGVYGVAFSGILLPVYMALMLAAGFLMMLGVEIA